MLCSMTNFSRMCEEIDASSLAEIIRRSSESLRKVLIVDCRCFLDYNDCHIRSAINAFYSKLMRRRLKEDKVCEQFLLNHLLDKSSTDKCLLPEIASNLDLVLYDETATQMETMQQSQPRLKRKCTPSSANNNDTNESGTKFIRLLHEKLRSSTHFNNIVMLKGGFVDFQHRFPELCESSTEDSPSGGDSSSNMLAAVPRSMANLSSLSQPCMTPVNEGPTKILPFLYLGSQHDALNPELLRKHEINYVINLSVNCPRPENVNADEHFLRIPVNDSYQEKLLPHFDKAFEFLDNVRQLNSVVLIHCLAGISRSPTLAIAYIMRHCNMSSDEAYRFVKQKRPSISPNFNFMGQLLEYEKQLKQQQTTEINSKSNSLDLFRNTNDNNNIVVAEKESPCSAQPSIDSALGESISSHSSFENENIDQCRRILVCPVKMAKSDAAGDCIRSQWESTIPEAENPASTTNENGKRSMCTNPALGQQNTSFLDRPRKLDGLRNRRAMHIPQVVTEDLPSPSSELQKLSFTPPVPEHQLSASNPFFSNCPTGGQSILHRQVESTQLTSIENPVFDEPKKSAEQHSEQLPTCSRSSPDEAPKVSNCARSALHRLGQFLLRRGPYSSTGGPTSIPVGGMPRSSTVGAFASNASSSRPLTNNLTVLSEQSNGSSRSLTDLNLDLESPESGFAEPVAAVGVVSDDFTSRSNFRRGDPERDSIGSQSSLEICVQ